jgi:hypothetical protein
MVMTLSTSLYTLAIATGDIKLYQIVVGSLSVSCFFITYVFYLFGAPVEAAYFVSIIINVLIMYARLIIVSKQTGLGRKLFVSSVLMRVISVSLLIMLGSYLSYKLFPKDSFLDACLVVILCILTVILSIYLVGLSKQEKDYFLTFVKKRIASK